MDPEIQKLCEDLKDLTERVEMRDRAKTQPEQEEKSERDKFDTDIRDLIKNLEELVSLSGGKVNRNTETQETDLNQKIISENEDLIGEMLEKNRKRNIQPKILGTLTKYPTLDMTFTPHTTPPPP